MVGQHVRHKNARCGTQFLPDQVVARDRIDRSATTEKRSAPMQRQPWGRADSVAGPAITAFAGDVGDQAIRESGSVHAQLRKPLSVRRAARVSDAIAEASA